MTKAFGTMTNFGTINYYNMKNIILLFLLLLSLATTAQKQTINNGESGATVRSKINSNFTELYDDLADTEEFDPATKANVASPTFTGTVTTPLIKITSGSPGAGKVATSDADGDVSWEAPASGSRASFRLTRFEFFTDCVNTFIASASGVVGDDMAMITSGTAGAGASVNTTGAVANRPGVVAVSTGTNAAGYVGTFAGSGLKLTGGAWVYEIAVRVPTLSTSGERFVFKCGLLNTISAIDELDAVSFIYDEGGVSTGSSASANWQLCAANASTRTYATTSIAVAANTWTKLRIEVNAAGTSAQFYVDDVSAGSPITTNLPGSTRNISISTFIMKNVGTTARTVDLDYVYGDLTFTSTR